MAALFLRGGSISSGYAVIKLGLDLLFLAEQVRIVGDEDLAAAIGSNFGGGMRGGATCGAIAAGYMVLGAKGIEAPAVLNEFRKCMAKKHDGMTDCADLLRANAAKGGEKKPHCDNMIEEVITLIDELTDGR